MGLKTWLQPVELEKWANSTTCVVFITVILVTFRNILSLISDEIHDIKFLHSEINVSNLHLSLKNLLKTCPH